MERVIRIGLMSLVWKTKALPLDDTRIFESKMAGRVRFELTRTSFGD